MAYKAGVCAVEGCGFTNRLHKGLCVGHYQRFKAHGDPMFGGATLVSCRHLKQVVVQGSTATVALTQGYVATIDAEDATAVGGHNWHAIVDENTVYAWTTIVAPDGTSRKVSLHAFLCHSDELVDHIDGDGLNNQRANLRPATHRQNQFNKKKARNNASGYKGVRFASWVAGPRKWRAQIMKDGRHISLRYHLTAEDAAMAYDAAAVELFGEFARLNFPVREAA